MKIEEVKGEDEGLLEGKREPFIPKFSDFQTPTCSISNVLSKLIIYAGVMEVAM